MLVVVLTSDYWASQDVLVCARTLRGDLIGQYFLPLIWRSFISRWASTDETPNLLNLRSSFLHDIFFDLLHQWLWRRWQEQIIPFRLRTKDIISLLVLDCDTALLKLLFACCEELFVHFLRKYGLILLSLNHRSSFRGSVWSDWWKYSLVFTLE